MNILTSLSEESISNGQRAAQLENGGYFAKQKIAAICGKLVFVRLVVNGEQNEGPKILASSPEISRTRYFN